MKKLLFWVSTILLTSGVAFIIYAGDAWRDAERDAEPLITRAQHLIASGQGPADLGEGRFAALILIEDPAFQIHNGVDFETPGAGATTITQSLAKRTAFETFRKGLPKIRQTVYALSLERKLTKPQIAALWLETAEMGRIEDAWTIGFFEASQALYGSPPADISDDQFITLIAVLIAPSRLQAAAPDRALEARIARIKKRLAGDCEPLDHSDVWLEGCR